MAGGKRGRCVLHNGLQEAAWHNPAHASCLFYEAGIAEEVIKGEGKLRHELASYRVECERAAGFQEVVSLLAGASCALVDGSATSRLSNVTAGEDMSFPTPASTRHVEPRHAPKARVPVVGTALAT